MSNPVIELQCLHISFDNPSIDYLWHQVQRIQVNRSRIETPRTAERRYVRLVRSHYSEYTLQCADYGRKTIHAPPGGVVRLHCDNSPGVQAEFNGAVELSCIKKRGWSGLKRFRKVQDNDIETPCAFLDILTCISDDKLETRIVERATAETRQHLTAHPYYFVVDVDHHYVFDRWMHENVAQGRSFATAGDEHLTRTGMGQHGRLDQGLVIDKLVPLARLNTSVKHE